MTDLSPFFESALQTAAATTAWIMNHRIGLQLIICLIAFAALEKKDLRKLLADLFAIYFLTCAVLVVLTAFYPAYLSTINDLRFYLFVAGLVGFEIARDALRPVKKHYETRPQ